MKLDHAIATCLYREEHMFRQMPHVTYRRMRDHLGRFFYEYNVEIEIDGERHYLNSIKPEFRNEDLCTRVAAKAFNHLLNGGYLNMYYWSKRG